jgi:hypothetical protein
VRAAQFIDTQFADARLYQPLKRASDGVTATQWPFLVADVPGNKVVKNDGDGLDFWERRPIAKRVLATINALAQVAGHANGLERGPVRPGTNGIAAFAATNPVVKDKGSGPTGSNPDAKSPGCLCALDGGSRKIGDAIALGRKRQLLDRILVQLRRGTSVSVLCPHRQFT